MPTIIKVQDTSERKDVYVNADQIQRVYTSSGQHTMRFADGSAMWTQESPDEIAALIRDAMRGYDIEFRTGNWPGLTEFRSDSDTPEGDTLYDQHWKNFQKWYGDPTPGTSASNER